MLSYKRLFSWVLVPIWAAVLLCMLEAQVFAQNVQSSSFQLQQFRPWGDPDGGFQTQSARSLGQWNYLVSMYFNVAKDPLVLRNTSGERVSDVVKYQLGADLGLSLGLLSFLDIQLRVPVSLYQDSVKPGDAGLAEGISVSGFFFSDIQLGAKVQLLRQKQHGLSLGFHAFLGFPTSTPGSFNGEESLSAGGSLLLSRRFSVVSIAAEVGYHYGSPSELGGLLLAHSLFYSAAGNITLAPDKFVAIVELSGRASVGTEARNTPLEVYVGGRFFPLGKPTLALSFGGALGVLPGVGAPLFRALVGVSWTPNGRGAGKGARIDTDGDGVMDDSDLCPRVKGATDNRGCPWADSDGDGLLDNVDRCPRVAGPKANDGCPWVDSDGDGLHDKLDRCPSQSGPRSNRGCPVVDRDNDGVADKVDNCPDIKGLPSLKGCPKVVLVRVTKSRIQILQKIYFATGSAKIRAVSFPILEQVASVLLSRPDIQVRIEGHTDNMGGIKSNQVLSLNRSMSVRVYLSQRGVSLSRMQVAGFGMTRPIASNDNAGGRQMNRRVEFHIIRR